MKELDRVALTEDVPAYNLKAGDIGMIVHAYTGDQPGYEVEFVTVHGDLIGLVAVYPSQIRALANNEIASARRVGSA